MQMIRRNMMRAAPFHWLAAANLIRIIKFSIVGVIQSDSQ